MELINPDIDISSEVCHLIKSCLTTACSTRATLAQIKNHSWMQHPLETFTLPFQQVLDMRLGKVGKEFGFEFVQKLFIKISLIKQADLRLSNTFPLFVNDYSCECGGKENILF